MAELIFDAIKAGLDGLPWMHNRGNLIAAEEILTESEVLLHEAHSVCRCFLKKTRPEVYGEICQICMYSHLKRKNYHRQTKNSRYTRPHTTVSYLHRIFFNIPLTGRLGGVEQIHHLHISPISAL